MSEARPQSQYEQLMQQTNITYRACEACHRAYVSSEIIEVENIQHRNRPSWDVCAECAKKVSHAFSIWQKEKRA